jgi:predicted dehydrogenase
LVAAGEIGTPLWAQSTYSRNSLAGEWNYFVEPEATARTVDWKRWLGKAPPRPFSAERYFRWRKYWDYSGGIATDLFYHRLGPLLFAMGPRFPSRVGASGGIYLQKDREVPDTYSTTVEYEDFFITLSGSMANAAATGLILPAIYGQKGTIVIEAAGVRVLPEPIYQQRSHSSRQTPGRLIPIEQPDLNEAHTNDFFGCMRSRSKPILNAHFGWQIMTAIRLGVDSYRQGRQMILDPHSQRLLDHAGKRASYEGNSENHPTVKPRQP